MVAKKNQTNEIVSQFQFPLENLTSGLQFCGWHKLLETLVKVIVGKGVPNVLFSAKTVKQKIISWKSA